MSVLVFRPSKGMEERVRCACGCSGHVYLHWYVLRVCVIAAGCGFDFHSSHRDITMGSHHFLFLILISKFKLVGLFGELVYGMCVVCKCYRCSAG